MNGKPVPNRAKDSKRVVKVTRFLDEIPPGDSLREDGMSDHEYGSYLGKLEAEGYFSKNPNRRPNDSPKSGLEGQA
jgi:hypothetical protein